MNKLTRIGLSLLMVVVVVSGCAFTTEGQIARQLKLGQKYILEGNYEQAVIAFNKVIDIDASRIEAYGGLIDTYVAQGDYDAADKTISDLYQSDAFTAIEEAFPKTESKKVARDNGTTIGLLHFTIDGDEGQYDQLYIYYGDVNDGVISGEGTLYYENGATYKGHWENDKPNGEGIYTMRHHFAGKTYDYWGTETVSGTFADGLENGNMTRVDADDDYTFTYHYTAQNGYAPTSTVIDETHSPTDNVVARSEESLTNKSYGGLLCSYLVQYSALGIKPYDDLASGLEQHYTHVHCPYD